MIGKLKNLIRKTGVVTLVFMMLLSITFTYKADEVYANTNEIRVSVDGKYVEFDVAPINDNGSVFVPMRAIFEALGYEVKWESDLRWVMATTIEKNYVMSIYLTDIDTMFLSYTEHITDYTDFSDKGNPELRLADEISLEFSYYIQFKPNYKSVDGRILVPVRAISEGSGAKVDWDGGTRTVIIDSSNPVIKDINTGISYELNKAEERVDSYFASVDNSSDVNNNSNYNTNNNYSNNTNEVIEMTREEKELEIIRLVNIERLNAGLNEVKLADDLVYVARWHSDEMAELDYFSHESPTLNLKYTELARALGADYSYAGENSHDSILIQL